MKSQRIRFPTVDQQLPTLLPLLYIGMPLSEAASDHILDSLCALHACWRKQRKQRALYGRTDIQVSVLVKGIVGFHLQLAQASRWHGTVFQGRIVFVTPWWSAKETRETETVRQPRQILRGLRSVRLTWSTDAELPKKQKVSRAVHLYGFQPQQPFQTLTKRGHWLPKVYRVPGEHSPSSGFCYTNNHAWVWICSFLNTQKWGLSCCTLGI